jgi:hypothetical protein
MTKLEQLKEMVARWEKEKSILLAYDICEFLSKNLEKRDERDTRMGTGETDEIL